MPDPAAQIDAYLDGTLDAAACVELERWIEADAANARLVAEYALLRRHLVETRRAAHADATPLKPDLSPRRTPTLRPPKRLVLALAAALLFAAAAVAIYVVAFSSKPETRDPRRDHPIATVLESTGTITAGDRIIGEGEDLPIGDLSLDAGHADFRLHNGVAVRLAGPTQLTIHDPMNATLVRGSASFDCPPAAKGYAVRLPDGSRVVDLGTRFAVHAGRDGRWRVRVIDGLVELRMVDGSVRPIAAGSTGTIDRNRGEVRVAARHEPIGVVESDFADGSPFDFEQIGSGEMDLADGAARFTGSGARFYLATLHTGYSAVPFTFEATATLVSRETDASGTALLGIGPVEPTGQFDLPGAPTAYVELGPASFAAGFVRFSHGGRSTDPLRRGNGGWGDGSTHRVRLIWDPATGRATFEVDQNYDGAFVADVSHTFEIDGTIEPASSRLFFGAGNGTRWDDVSIELGAAIEPPTER